MSSSVDDTFVPENLSMLTHDEKAVIDAGREVLSPYQSDVVVSFQYALTKQMIVYIPGHKACVRDPSHLANLLQNQTEMMHAFSNELATANYSIQDATFRCICMQVAHAIAEALETGQIPVVTTASFQNGAVEFATDVLRKVHLNPASVPFRLSRREPTVFVYGPPGAGKSTTLTFANKRPDLLVEDAGNFFALRRSRLDTEHFSSEIRPFSALLLPPLESYFKRMEGRNETFPDKRGQHEMRSYAKWNGRQDWFDLVVSDPYLAPDRLIDLLASKLDG